MEKGRKAMARAPEEDWVNAANSAKKKSLKAWDAEWANDVKQGEGPERAGASEAAPGSKFR